MTARALVFYVACALTAVGLGLVFACSFLPDERRILAGAGMAVFAIGGTLLLITRGRQARTSVKSWTGPAAVGFVIGVPLLIGLGVYRWIHP